TLASPRSQVQETSRLNKRQPLCGSQVSSMHRTRSLGFSCSTATWTLRTSMQIRDLDPEAPEEREVCAQLLVEEFRDIAPDAWPIIGKARETVDECLRNGPVRVARVYDTIVGWIGGHHVFSRVWELHPLVVARMAQKQG